VGELRESVQLLNRTLTEQMERITTLQITVGSLDDRIKAAVEAATAKDLGRLEMRDRFLVDTDKAIGKRVDSLEHRLTGVEGRTGLAALSASVQTAMGDVENRIDAVERAMKVTLTGRVTEAEKRALAASQIATEVQRRVDGLAKQAKETADALAASQDTDEKTFDAWRDRLSRVEASMKTLVRSIDQKSPALRKPATTESELLDEDVVTLEAWGKLPGSHQHVLGMTDAKSNGQKLSQALQQCGLRAELVAGNKNAYPVWLLRAYHVWAAGALHQKFLTGKDLNMDAWLTAAVAAYKARAKGA
jgi:hypothetical protein